MRRSGEPIVKSNGIREAPIVMRKGRDTDMTLNWNAHSPGQASDCAASLELSAIDTTGRPE